MFSLRNTITVLSASILASSLSVQSAPSPASPITAHLTPQRRGTVSGSGSTSTSTSAGSTSAAVGTQGQFGFTNNQQGFCFSAEESALTSIFSGILGGIGGILGESASICLCVGYDGYVYSNEAFNTGELTQSQSSSLAGFGSTCVDSGFSGLLGGSNQCKQQCSIPANAQPDLQGSNSCCGFTCPYGACGTGCLASGQTCVSGVPTTPAKSGWGKRSSMKCPSGLQLCPTSNHFNADYECVNSSSDIYSCGGCVYGSADNVTLATGQDCTSIPHAADVSCRKGSCVVETCDIGYENVPGQGCVYSAKVAFKMQKYRL